MSDRCVLSYDSLLAHAAERGLPPGKARGIVLEYVAVVSLKALTAQRGARGLIFLGGTALRLGYGLPRFSEDLDFDVEALTAREWKALLERAAHDLSRAGFPVEVRAEENGSLLTGDLRFTEMLQAYGLASHPREKLRVKVEANRPGYPLTSEPRVVSAYGEMFPAVFAAPSLAFAEKILALLSRELGRDVYDIFFMAGKRWAPDARVLSARNITGRPAQVILSRVKGWGPQRLQRMARRLEPFLFEAGQARLVAEADRLLPEALEYLTGK